ncbi:GNAT family N-acetyltransferase [Patiriisocius hiemis]|uniref:GNAT family N-acetyltransferase n=1 Tax=Patiriisocius hiemis TaxID=3075604 RepID=A0ABU2YAI2_9FLAO|nr:GNAT family N-acetyltransferase [Constantimarinum sp. W242]MDT0554639.1 GNAT family N-acetyltransferase [Constantimarinum sp. W242]
MKIHIETNRLILRRLIDTDAEGIFKLDSNPRVHEYLGKKPISILTEAKDIIINIQQQYEKYDIGRLAIIDKSTNDFIGWAGLKYETDLRKEFHYYDIGYRLREEYWGKGIGTEAAIASLYHGFNDLKLNKICAAAEIPNIGSNKILQKIGLKPSGQFIYDDTLLNWYGLTRKEWLSSN